MESQRLAVCALAIVLSLLCCSLAVGSQVVSFPRHRTLRQLSRSEVLLTLRGGSTASTTQTSFDAESLLRRYFEEESKKEGKFFIQGWRWHTMSVMREAERLQKLALRIAGNETMAGPAELHKAADYVVDFNLQALHRVERMFFPFVRKGIADSNDLANPQINIAVESVLKGLEEDQKKLSELGKSIMRCVEPSSINNNAKSTSEVARTVATQSGAMVDLTRSMLDREINLVMPAVGRFISEKEQKKFNNKVIKFLGVLESRCHLVHMHEVVTETNCPTEQQLWKESIPSLPRKMIPRWKRTLYEPRASILDCP